MNAYIRAASVLTLFGGGLAFLMALEQMVHRVKTRYNRLLFFFLLTTGWFLICIGLVVLDIAAVHPWTMFLFLTVIFAVGPLGLLYFHSLLEPVKPLTYRVLVHLLPAGLIMAAEIILFTLTRGYSYLHIEILLSDPLHHPLTAVIIAGALHMIGYFSYLLKISLPLRDSQEARTEVRIVIFIEISGIILVSMILAGFLTKSKVLMVTGSMIDALLHITLFLARSRYPKFFAVLGSEMRSKRYQKSLLKGLNTDEIYSRLMELMNEERIYRDPELTMSALAERLFLTPHQLSQFLNEYLNQSFRSFINAYRIEEAKTLLLTDHDRSVLSICFEVGFNSKSVFNQAFKKSTGMSPSEYRLHNGATVSN